MNGWKIYAAMPPPPSVSSSDSRRYKVAPLAKFLRVDEIIRSGADKHHNTDNDNNDRQGPPLRHHPCILMLGNEGRGLRTQLSRKADFSIAIMASAAPATSQKYMVKDLDSLNVGVAAGILCQAFLSLPFSSSPSPSSSSRQSEKRPERELEIQSRGRQGEVIIEEDDKKVDEGGSEHEERVEAEDNIQKSEKVEANVKEERAEERKEKKGQTTNKSGDEYSFLD